MQTDQGKEFLGAAFQNLFKRMEIGFPVARNPDIKAALVERLNGILRERISWLSGRTTYFGETFKNHVFQRCVEEPRISAKRSKTTYFDEALKNHVFHMSFFFLKFCSGSTASFKD